MAHDTTAQNDAVIIEPTSQHKNSIIWLHGLGADGNDFVPIVPQLNFDSLTNTRFIFPHASVRPVTINGGIPMRAWFDITMLTETADLDLEGIFAARDRIHSLIEDEIARGVASENIIVAGFSQGGTLSLLSGLSFPKKIGGVIALSCYIPKGGFSLMDLQSANRDTKIFLAHGKYDPGVPYEFGVHAKEGLQTHGYDVTWCEYKMEHSVCPEEINDISLFLTQLGF